MSLSTGEACLFRGAGEVTGDRWRLCGEDIRLRPSSGEDEGLCFLPATAEGEGRRFLSSTGEREGRFFFSATGEGEGRRFFSTAGEGEGRLFRSAIGEGEGRLFLSATGDDEGRRLLSAGGEAAALLRLSSTGDRDGLDLSITGEALRLLSAGDWLGLCRSVFTGEAFRIRLSPGGSSFLAGMSSAEEDESRRFDCLTGGETLGLPLLPFAGDPLLGRLE